MCDQPRVRSVDLPVSEVNRVLYSNMHVQAPPERHVHRMGISQQVVGKSERQILSRRNDADTSSTTSADAARHQVEPEK